MAIYINSGVLYFPAAARDFVDTIAREALDDEAWERLIFPGKLYDNRDRAGLDDGHVSRVVQTRLVEALGMVKALGRSRDRESSYFADPLSVRAVAFATPDPHAEWNGLRCGGAYLDGQEYNLLREVVRVLGIERVLETGAGDSSILFRSFGVDTWLLQSEAGPWADRARAQGCRVIVVPFGEQPQRFEETALVARLADERLERVDLVFIDSPVGTVRRASLVGQLTGLVRTRDVLYHDALRDAANIYADQQDFGLRMIQWFGTPRGLVLFEMPVSKPGRRPVPMRRTDIVLAEPRARLKLVDPPRFLRTGARVSLQLDLENTSAEVFSSDFTDPLHIGYHWLDSSGRVVAWDGLRTRLPHDVYPNDRCRCRFDVGAPNLPGSHRLRVSLVQEMICWFHDHDPEAIAEAEIDVVAHPEASSCELAPARSVDLRGARS